MAQMDARPQDRRIRHHPVLGPGVEREAIPFTIDGQLAEARDGDTVAAALLAVGCRVFRTMPRTGEARGGYCFIGRCTDCLMIIDGEPNQMACQTIVREGMRIERQHGLGAWTSEDHR